MLENGKGIQSLVFFFSLNFKNQEVLSKGYWQVVTEHSRFHII